jgi:hypothetical protein
VERNKPKKSESVEQTLPIFCILVTMATAAILKFFNPPKSCHTLQWIFLQSFMKFDEKNPQILKSNVFCFHGNCGKVCPTDFVSLSRKKFKMAAVAMATKVQKMLNSLRTVDTFET